MARYIQCLMALGKQTFELGKLILAKKNSNFYIISFEKMSYSLRQVNILETLNLILDQNVAIIWLANVPVKTLWCYAISSADYKVRQVFFQVSPVIIISDYFMVAQNGWRDLENLECSKCISQQYRWLSKVSKSSESKGKNLNQLHSIKGKLNRFL